MIRQRVRTRFAKQGDLRLLGHQDLARAIERMLRRSGIKLSQTEGFHPHSRISFPLALSVGIAATDEVLEFDMSEEMPLEALRAVLAEHAPPGLCFTSVELVPAGQKKAMAESIELRVELPADRRAAAEASAATFLAAQHWPIMRPGRRAPLDLRGDVMELTIDEDGLRMRLAIGLEGSARPREVLAALGLEDLEKECCILTRTQVRLRQEPTAAR